MSSSHNASSTLSRHATDIQSRSNGRVGGGETGTEPLGSLVQRGVFSDSATTKIFIMTPATYDLDLNDGSIEGKPAVPEREQRASLLTSVDPPLFDGNTPGGPPDRLTPMKAALSALMPGVPISQFNYRRQVDDAKVRGQAYGKATVSDDTSRHVLFPRSCRSNGASFSSVACTLQASRVQVVRPMLRGNTEAASWTK